MKTMRLLLVAAGVLAVAALSGPALASTGHGLKKIRDPGHVTGIIRGRCYYRDKGQLPDPRCTPGSIDPIVTRSDIRSTICKKDWTATVRPPERRRRSSSTTWPTRRTGRPQVRRPNSTTWSPGTGRVE